MFPLFKPRNIGELIQDTILFIKNTGKHYFKQYFAINAVLLALLIIAFYFIGKVYLGLSGLLNSEGNYNQFDYINTNFNKDPLTFISVLVFCIFILLIASIINFTYPVIYFELYLQHKEQPFSYKEIILKLKSVLHKIIFFFIGFLFIILPLFFVVVTINLLLCFILIGFPLFLITLPSFFTWITLVYYTYITQNTGFFRALKIGLDLLKQNYWTTIITTLLSLFIVQVIQGILFAIPSLAIIWFLFTGVDENLDQTMVSLPIVTTSIMVISSLINFIFQNFILINQGIIYYSLREIKEDNSLNNEIDLIGKYEQ